MCRDSGRIIFAWWFSYNQEWWKWGICEIDNTWIKGWQDWASCHNTFIMRRIDAILMSKHQKVMWMFNVNVMLSEFIFIWTREEIRKVTYHHATTGNDENNPYIVILISLLTLNSWSCLWSIQVPRLLWSVFTASTSERNTKMDALHQE